MQIKHWFGNPCRLLSKAGAQPASPWQPAVTEAPYALDAAAPSDLIFSLEDALP